jgi:DNA repair protein RecO (recombination protein O)
MFDRLRINCFKSIISIIDQYFLEIENFNLLYKKFLVFLKNLGDDDIKNSQIIANYVRIELLILESLGYGIDFSKCVVSNSKVNLAYVSPKSAHAVSYEIGKDYANKLLPLPKFLNHEFTEINDDLFEDIEDFLSIKNLIDGLNLSGFFLKKYLFIDGKQDVFSNNFYRENIFKITNAF